MFLIQDFAQVSRCVSEGMRVSRAVAQLVARLVRNEKRDQHDDATEQGQREGTSDHDRHQQQADAGVDQCR
jgi:hypothetical protein